jgi:hypothetical protein
MTGDTWSQVPRPDKLGKRGKVLVKYIIRDFPLESSSEQNLTTCGYSDSLGKGTLLLKALPAVELHRI